MMPAIRFMAVVGFFLLPAIGTATAQQTPVPVEQTLKLGDEVSGTSERRPRLRYGLDIKDADVAVDVVLFSTDNSTLVILDGQGDRIGMVERMQGYGYEVFTWKPGDENPAQIEVRFLEEDGDYSVSVLPSEQHTSEEPLPGEQVKRWDDVEVGQAGSTRMVTVPYLLYVPDAYDASQQYPFILFMHGLGETGPRLDFLKTQVIPKLIEDGQDFPFIIASPQLAYGHYWENEVNMVASFIEHLQSEFPIDPDRIYVTGLSLGGSGVWHYALAHPDVPAAVVPMAGWYNWASTVAPKNICDLAKVPVWAFHGAQDEVIDLAWEQALVDALEACGADVRFTIYPDADHSQSFERGFADPALYAWLLEQHK